MYHRPVTLERGPHRTQQLGMCSLRDFLSVAVYTPAAYNYTRRLVRHHRLQPSVQWRVGDFRSQRHPPQQQAAHVPTTETIKSRHEEPTDIDQQRQGDR